MTLSFSLHLSDILTSIPVGPGYTGSNAWAYLDGLGAVNFLQIHDNFGTPPASYTVSGTYNLTYALVGRPRDAGNTTNHLVTPET